MLVARIESKKISYSDNVFWFIITAQWRKSTGMLHAYTIFRKRKIQKKSEKKSFAVQVCTFNHSTQQFNGTESDELAHLADKRQNVVVTKVTSEPNIQVRVVLMLYFEP